MQRESAATVTAECETDAECDDRDACNGTETCDPTSNTCVRGAEPDCDDDNPCTADSCDAEVGCLNDLVDADGDGFAAGTCPAGTPDGDCDDDDDTVYPGAPELCDEIDNDCDEAVDDDVEMVTCLRDADGDGFGHSATTMEACSCPDGWVPPRADGRTDCQDLDPMVHPDQTMYFAEPYCGFAYCGGIPPAAFDYNCDTDEQRRWTLVVSSTTCRYVPGIGCTGEFGWSGAVPDCGDEGSWSYCRSDCTRTTESKAQECR